MDLLIQTLEQQDWRESLFSFSKSGEEHPGITERKANARNSTMDKNACLVKDPVPPGASCVLALVPLSNYADQRESFC